MSCFLHSGVSLSLFRKPLFATCHRVSDDPADDVCLSSESGDLALFLVHRPQYFKTLYALQQYYYSYLEFLTWVNLFLLIVVPKSYVL